jgi:hypothetical protein
MTMPRIDCEAPCIDDTIDPDAYLDFEPKIVSVLQLLLTEVAEAVRALTMASAELARSNSILLKLLLETDEAASNSFAIMPRPDATAPSCAGIRVIEGSVGPDFGAVLLANATAGAAAFERQRFNDVIKSNAKTMVGSSGAELLLPVPAAGSFCSIVATENIGAFSAVLVANAAIAAAGLERQRVAALLKANAVTFKLPASTGSAVNFCEVFAVPRVPPSSPGATPIPPLTGATSSSPSLTTSAWAPSSSSDASGVAVQVKACEHIDDITLHYRIGALGGSGSSSRASSPAASEVELCDYCDSCHCQLGKEFFLGLSSQLYHCGLCHCHCREQCMPCHLGVGS